MEFIVASHNLFKIKKLLFDKRARFNFKTFAANKCGKISEHHKITFCVIFSVLVPQSISFDISDNLKIKIYIYVLAGYITRIYITIAIILYHYIMLLLLIIMHDLFYPELILHWLILLKAFMEKKCENKSWK